MKLIELLLFIIYAPFIFVAGVIRDLRAALARKYGLRISSTEAPWEVDEERSITTSVSLKTIETAFRDEGFIFGWHTYYRHYDPGAYVLFDSLTSFQKSLSSAIAGDRFTLYSSNSLPEDCVVARFDPASIRLREEAMRNQLKAIRSIVDQEDSEIIYVLDAGKHGRSLDYACGAFDEDDWRDQLEEWQSMSGELWVYDESRLGKPLVDLWKPNSRGRVPTGGFTV